MPRKIAALPAPTGVCGGLQIDCEQLFTWIKGIFGNLSQRDHLGSASPEIVELIFGGKLWPVSKETLKMFAMRAKLPP